MADRAIAGRRRKVPLLRQAETSECGLVCLAMIAAYHGSHRDLAAFRSLREGSRGMTLADVIDTAKRLRLAARPLRLGVPDLKRLRLPAVLHWRMQHFVVLVSCGRRHCVVHDPAAGRRKVTPSELDASFTGIALELWPATGFRPCKERKTLSFADFAGSFRHLYRYLGLMFCLLMSTQLLALAPPVATQILVDELLLGQDRDWLYRALAGLALIMLTSILLEALRRWTGLFSGTRLAIDSAAGIMTRFFSLPAGFFHRRHTGDLLSRLESLEPLREALTDHVVNSIVHGSVLLTTLAIMVLYSGALTAVSVAGFSLSILIVVLILPQARRHREQAVRHLAAQDDSLVESIRACDTVKALGLEQSRLAHWHKHFSDATNARVREGRLSIAQQVATDFVGVFEQVLFLGVGITGVLEREFTLGVLFAFMSLRSRFGSALLGLVDAIGKFSLLKIHTGRLSDIALAEPEPAIPAGAITSTIDGSIQAENLTFAYEPGAWIVHDFRCAIVAGTHVVITGPSGCGKTTLLKLLAGQLVPNSGQVCIDDMDLQLWNHDSVRAQTAFVLQNDSLFQGTIAENICAFDTTPDLARVCVAAVTAEIWRDIQALPMKLATQISDMGRNLSGGQVQRLILARALYRKPAILFLDEATSHLDVVTERRILKNIAALGITVVSVAHRPDVIENAQQVISLSRAPVPAADEFDAAQYELPMSPNRDRDAFIETADRRDC